MANLKFYMTPGSCSTGIHLLLEELELFFEAHVVNLLAGDHLKPAFRALNPRGSVPVLVRTDGTALTDFISIARWLASTHPNHHLLPESDRETSRLLQVMEYVVGVIHGEGFTRVFVSDRYAQDSLGKTSTEREGRQIVSRGFDRVETMIFGSPYISEAFSIADAALFYVEFWADREGIPLPPKCERHYKAMLTRRAVRQVLGEEGYHSVLRRYPA
ncbi:MAG TPA: glutathione S-transferase family protein [Polyangiaceae bacterium]|nr:glutathione S-transferase family protein [Polyangiaceae bacterium]